MIALLMVRPTTRRDDVWMFSANKGEGILPISLLSGEIGKDLGEPPQIDLFEEWPFPSSMPMLRTRTGLSRE
jgi:hypothetical protein